MSYLSINISAMRKLICVIATCSILLPAFPQNDTIKVFVSKGEAFYKSQNSWLPIRDGFQVHDTNWIKLGNTESRCMLIKSKLCGVIADTNMIQVAMVAFENCDNSGPGNFIRKLNERIKPSKPGYPVKVVSISNDYYRKALFPARGEQLAYQQPIGFYTAAMADNGGDQWKNIHLVIPDDERMNGVKPSSLKWSTKKILKDSVIISTDELFHRFGFLPPTQKLKWYADGDDRLYLNFGFMQSPEKMRLDLKLAQTDSLRKDLDTGKYLLARAFVYEDFKMYTEAFKIYRALIGLYPDSIFYQTLYTEFLRTIAYLNND